MPDTLRVRRLVAVALAATVAGVSGTALEGCTAGSDSGPSPPTTAAATEATEAGTPLADLDTTTLAVRRAPFCDQVDPAAVSRALGREPGHASAYRSGQRTRISPGLTDVIHEYGCTWTAGTAQARAWVFAPPITRKRAAGLARDARTSATCGRELDGVVFGRPFAACVARGEHGTEVRFQGLFGDAWLTCALSLPGGEQHDLVDRAGRWCAAVATGASTAP
jgi:hypothetical protein